MAEVGWRPAATAALLTTPRATVERWFENGRRSWTAGVVLAAVVGRAVVELAALVAAVDSATN